MKAAVAVIMILTVLLGCQQPSFADVTGAELSVSVQRDIAKLLTLENASPDPSMDNRIALISKEVAATIPTNSRFSTANAAWISESIYEGVYFAHFGLLASDMFASELIAQCNKRFGSLTDSRIYYQRSTTTGISSILVICGHIRTPPRMWSSNSQPV